MQIQTKQKLLDALKIVYTHDKQKLTKKEWEFLEVPVNHKEKEILDFLIERYGEYIVFEPQMNIKNIFLWYFPFIILALSLVFLILRIKKN